MDFGFECIKILERKTFYGYVRIWNLPGAHYEPAAKHRFHRQANRRRGKLICFFAAITPIHRNNRANFFVSSLFSELDFEWRAKCTQWTLTLELLCERFFISTFWHAGTRLDRPAVRSRAYKLNQNFG